MFLCNKELKIHVLVKHKKIFKNEFEKNRKIYQEKFVFRDLKFHKKYFHKNVYSFGNNERIMLNGSPAINVYVCIHGE